MRVRLTNKLGDFVVLVVGAESARDVGVLDKRQKQLHKLSAVRCCYHVQHLPKNILFISLFLQWGFGKSACTDNKPFSKNACATVASDTHLCNKMPDE